ncbi:MAG: hypothetical protein CMG75_09730 [Candidatus Marinimicrobia bacterium]|nr:hypothetical protein [Candidatus Neomarinimicrobiota bacterium]|tara:strand:- start:7522 stop:7893 length:372 start_codon:yes stop_codon:yes gene_type:complete
MNLKLICRIGGLIPLINGLVLVFFTSMFMDMLSWEITDALLTLGEVFGVSLIVVGIITYRSPDIAGDSLSAFGQLFGVTNCLFVLIIGYHIISGQASGAPAYGNIVFTAVLAILFFVYSKNTD